MGWFDEQIKQKIKNDEAGFFDALQGLSGAVTGREYVSAMEDERTVTIEAVSQILRFYRVKPREIPGRLKDMNGILEYLMRPYGFMRREVRLVGTWYQDGIGAMLGYFRDSKKPVALIPGGSHGYVFTEEKTGKKVKVTKKNAGQFLEEALCFYKPFQLKPVKWKDLLTYGVSTLSGADFASMFFAAAAAAGMGLFIPCANNLIFENAAKTGSINVLAACAVLMAGVGIASGMLLAVRQLVMAGMKTKMGISVESAAMMRVLTLPADFFGKYSAGELAARVQSIGGLCGKMLEIAFAAGLAAVFFIVYMAEIYVYAPMLALPVAAILFLLLLADGIQAVVQMRLGIEKQELLAKENGMVFSMLTGIQKIKLSGAERRMFARWAGRYAQQARLEYNPPFFVKAQSVIRTGILLAGNIAIYYRAAKAQMSAADYMSFTAAYSMLAGAFLSLAEMAGTLVHMRACYEMLRPILEELPAVAGEKSVVTRLSGGIELNNVSFGYQEDMPLILDNLSLKIRPGQYVAVVGRTGCGKSTLMRLLLGFEKPQKGAVYYDGKDLNGLDLKSLRRFMGVVMQNGKLFPGDIYSNITISAPGLTVEQAFEAAEMAGLAEDIRKLPMGMNTLISESGGGFSGGQKQRLMIARAVAAKPRILLFDEATSALDNITQRMVSESLDKMKCTRIVVAHRLSTIRQCDRIVVLDQGRIIEDGTYEELMEKRGMFAELARRQMAEG